MKYPSIYSAQTIILYCEKFGFKNIVISPGSRNAPLAIGFASNKNFNCYSIVDERSAGFFALGISQQTKTPTILVCTSGSALLNYFPAVSEAYYSNIPLIVISADRPTYKVNIGDGQTIVQQGVFKNAILDSSSLALDPKHNFKEIFKSNKQKIIPKKFTEKTLEAEQKKTQVLNEKTINSLFTKAISESLPVHLNAPFEEPLYNFKSTPSVKINTIVKNSIKKTTNTFLSNSLVKKYSRIMILVGCSDANVLSENLKNKISQFDNIVVLKETTSNLRHDSFFGKIDQIIAPIELSANRDKIFEKLKPELLITIGGMIISKKIKTMLRNHRPLSHIHLGKYGSKDTFYIGVKHFKVDPSYFFDKTLDIFKCNSNYKSEWENLSKLRKESHKNYMPKVKFCDLKVFSKISEIIPENYSVQVSNSSAIRYMQLFDQNPSSNFNCNRGTSGIDGSTSTAIGASIGSKSPTLLISGDLSFLYDSNGLWNNYTEKSFRIIIINNSGGGIFKILPGYLNDKTHEKFIETRHNFSAKQLAKMHGFKYMQASSSFGLKFALLNFFKSSSRPKILEIFTDSSLSAKVLEDYFLNLKKS